jgi:hypothetical protein
MRLCCNKTLSRSVLVAAIAAGVLVPICCWARSPKLALPPSADADYENVLRREIADRENWRSRAPGGHLSLDALLPGSSLIRKYPVSYGREVLICSGPTAVESLLKLTEKLSDRALLGEVATVLSYSDDERVIETFRVGHLPLPNDPRAEAMSYALKAAKGVDPLSELDGIVAAEEQGGYFVNPEILRWLNQVFGEDLDQHLQGCAPLALEFRNRQLKKGYDPAIALRRLAVPLLDDTAIKSLFDKREDQEGCRQLLRVVYCDSLPEGKRDNRLEVVRRPGWSKQFASWYRQNRAQLAYDRQLHRYVVGSRRAGRSAEGSTRPSPESEAATSPVDGR